MPFIDQPFLAFRPMTSLQLVAVAVGTSPRVMRRATAIGTLHTVWPPSSRYLWPKEHYLNGFWTVLEVERCDESDPTLYRFGSPVCRSATAELESAIDEFIPQIIYLMENVGFSDTNLHHLWEDLYIERQNPEIARFRRFEALLGCDPDELECRPPER